MRFNTKWLIAASAAVVAGCGGGGGTPVAPISQPSTSPATAVKTTTQLIVKLPLRGGAKRYALGSRKPTYVSPSTAGMIATVTDPDVGGGAAHYQGYTLAAGIAASADSPASCGPADSNGFTCTLTFALVPDAANPYAVTLTAYDAAESGTTGRPTSVGDNALSTDTQHFTVQPNVANTIAFTLQGIVRGFYATRQFHGIPNVGGTYAVTFLPLDADGNPISGSEGLAYDNGSTFVENGSFSPTVTAVHCLTTPCYTLDSSVVPIASGATDTFVVDYNGESDPGTPGVNSTAAPGFGQVGLVAPDGYVGYTGSPTGSAASEYLEPLFPAVDQTATPSYASGPAAVAFTQPSQSIVAYGIQANVDTGSAGYFVDDSDCSNNAVAGDIANAGALSANVETNFSPTTPFGTSFTITSGSPSLPASGTSSSSVTCTIKIYDDRIAPATPASGSSDEADIAVSYTPNGATLTIAPGSPATPNARSRGAH